MKCKCGAEWLIQDNLAVYDEEIVLVCLSCGERYFNAQMEFSETDLKQLQHVQTKKGEI